MCTVKVGFDTGLVVAIDVIGIEITDHWKAGFLASGDDLRVGDGVANLMVGTVVDRHGECR